MNLMIYDMLLVPRNRQADLASYVIFEKKSIIELEEKKKYDQLL